MPKLELPQLICLVSISFALGMPRLPASGENLDNRSHKSSSSKPELSTSQRRRPYGANNSEAPWSSGAGGGQGRVWYGTPDSLNASSSVDKAQAAGTVSSQSTINATVKSGGAQGSNASLSDLSETDQMRLQMNMDRKSKFDQTMSNVLKKQSDTSDAIINNMK